MNVEHLIHQLAAEIDSDSPPGLAANNLARAAVFLVREREPKQAVALEKELNDLAFKYQRDTE